MTLGVVPDLQPKRLRKAHPAIGQSLLYACFAIAVIRYVWSISAENVKIFGKWVISGMVHSAHGTWAQHKA
jgi:hypothetical protein